MLLPGPDSGTTYSRHPHKPLSRWTNGWAAVADLLLGQAGSGSPLIIHCRSAPGSLKSQAAPAQRFLPRASQSPPWTRAQCLEKPSYHAESADRAVHVRSSFWPSGEYRAPILAAIQGSSTMRRPSQPIRPLVPWRGKRGARLDCEAGGRAGGIDDWILPIQKGIRISILSSAVPSASSSSL